MRSHSALVHLTTQALYGHLYGFTDGSRTKAIAGSAALWSPGISTVTHKSSFQENGCGHLKYESGSM